MAKTITLRDLPAEQATYYQRGRRKMPDKIKSKRQWRRLMAAAKRGEIPTRTVKEMGIGVDFSKLPETVSQATGKKGQGLPPMIKPKRMTRARANWPSKYTINYPTSEKKPKPKKPYIPTQEGIQLPQSYVNPRRKKRR